MLTYIWDVFLYQPLFNALIWIYSNVAGQNLGWAVVWLTVFLRVLLLPLSIISARDALKQEKVQAEAQKMAAALKYDQVAQQEEYRRIMKKNRISPWAKAVVLLVQILVLVLLYQVFIHGITGERILRVLYDFVDYPGQINVNFYGFDIGTRHDSLWAGVCALYLLVVIYFEHGRRQPWSSSEAMYLVMFPVFTFAALWYLPMVKSLFILTTMIFSTILAVLEWFFVSAKKSAPAH